MPCLPKQSIWPPLIRDVRNAMKVNIAWLSRCRVVHGGFIDIGKYLDIHTHAMHTQCALKGFNPRRGQDWWHTTICIRTPSGGLTLESPCFHGEPFKYLYRKVLVMRSEGRPWLQILVKGLAVRQSLASPPPLNASFILFTRQQQIYIKQGKMPTQNPNAKS